TRITKTHSLVARQFAEQLSCLTYGAGLQTQTYTMFQLLLKRLHKKRRRVSKKQSSETHSNIYILVIVSIPDMGSLSVLDHQGIHCFLKGQVKARRSSIIGVTITAFLSELLRFLRPL